MPPTLAAQSLNHWTTRDIPRCVEWRLPNLLQNLSPAWQGILAEGWGFPLVQLPSQCLNLVCSLPARSSSHSLNTSSDVKLIFFSSRFFYCRLYSLACLETRPDSPGGAWNATPSMTSVFRRRRKSALACANTWSSGGEQRPLITSPASRGAGTTPSNPAETRQVRRKRPGPSPIHLGPTRASGKATSGAR